MATTEELIDVMLDFRDEYYPELRKRGIDYIALDDNKEGMEKIVVDVPTGSSIEGLPTQYKGVPVEY